jgi:Tfp pilus assembly protein PilF
MRSIAALLICLALAACAHGPTPAPSPEDLFRDAEFAAPSERVAGDDLFVLSDGMRQFLWSDILQRVHREGRQKALVDALYQRGQLKLEYDAAMTRNAAQAFDARAGNCLSLVIMTAAFAKELGLEIEYRSAYLEETWSRNGSLVFLSGHVNVTLGPRLVDARHSVDERTITIDFLPPDDVRAMRSRTIDEATVVAMYMNNRAAEALVQGRSDDAYAWARESLRRSRWFGPAYNTLAVVYLRRGDAVAAELAVRRLLATEPANTRALSNLALALKGQGRDEEAAQVQRQLARLEPYPPFYFFSLGQAAMERGDYAAARDWFAKEVARADYYHEFHFWLGLAAFRLGDMAQARKELTRAMDESPSRRDHDLYAAKLAWIRSRPQP